MPGELQPLSQNFAIVDANGFPTQYFIKWAQQRQIDISSGITAAQAQQLFEDYLTLHPLQAGLGISITPDGNISNDPTIALNAVLDDLQDVDLSTPPTNDQVLTYDNASSTWKAKTPTGGGGSPPTLKGSAIYAFNGATYNANFPAGSLAGDVCVVGSNHAFAVTAPTGWTSLSNLVGANTNGAAFYKTLSGADIAAGFVTVNYASSFDGCIGIEVYDGASVTAVTLASDARNAGSTGTVNLSTNAILASDNVFAYGGSRGNGAVGFSLGTVDQTVASANASASVGNYQPLAGGTFNQVFSYASDPNGNYSVLVIVHGTPSSGGGGATFTDFFVEPNNNFYSDAIATQGCAFLCQEDCTIYALMGYLRQFSGATWVPAIYEVNATTGAIVALVADGPSWTSGTTIDFWKCLPLSSPVNLIAGKTYVMVLQRTDGSTSAIVGFAFNSGGSAFRNRALQVTHVVQYAANATMAPGFAATLFSATIVVYSMGVVIGI